MRLRLEANEEEAREQRHWGTLRDTPELFQVWHHCTKLNLRVRARMTDQVFLTHIRALLADEGVYVADPGPDDSALSYSLTFTNN